VLVTLDGGPVAEVDEGIAELVAALWRAGYRTTSSCQDMGEFDASLPAVAMVGFTTKAQAQRFARLVGGRVVEPKLEERERDDYGVPLTTVAVTFPASAIGEALERVEGRVQG
jgi:hypothetical protein